MARGIENIEFACGIPNLLKGSSNSEISTGVDIRTVLEPLGVVAGITPFNFPIMVPLWMMANAIACGNCFVLKPSEKDPSASLVLADIVQRAGFPDGVFNVVQGDREAVEALLAHPDVAAVSFVGSTPVARHVYETGTRHGQAGPGAWRGEEPHGRLARCRHRRRRRRRGVRRLRVGRRAVHGHFGRRRRRAGGRPAGRGHRQPDSRRGDRGRRRGGVHDGAADHGGAPRPVCSPTSTGAADEGAKVVVDGSDPDAPSGFFLGCSLLDDVKPGMRVYDDEIFGPVLSVVRVPTLDEALALVNDNPYGNGTAVFTRDGGSARRFEREVQVGMVGINVPIPVPVASHSFGGWKASIFGDSSIYGPDGIRFYTRPKVVTSRWPDPGPSSMELHFPTNR